MMDPSNIDKDIAKAVRFFWSTGNQQANKQIKDGRADQGARGSATGGKQMDGFVEIIRRIVQDLGIPKSCIHSSTALELPGFFRPEKKWDLIVVDQGTLVVAIEFKSQVGPSFGNNFNNRSEEAIGSAQDVWTAYREGAFRASDRPWLGFVMLLEDCEGSTKPVQVKQPHFDVFPEFNGASYADRYTLLMNKLMRERLYDSCALLMSSRKDGAKGKSKTLDSTLSFEQLVSALSARIISHLSLSAKKPNRLD
jgi:hypothetical protein